VRARIRGALVDASRRLQSVYVPAGDGVRLAVDVWLPAERTAAGGTVGAVMRVTRYHRAEALPEPGPDRAPLLPVSAVVPAGHRIRVAVAGHDASCFTRYGPAQEAFTLDLGRGSHLDLPVRCG
jgi:predicted acyl esterase